MCTSLQPKCHYTNNIVSNYNMLHVDNLGYVYITTCIPIYVHVHVHMCPGKYEDMDMHIHMYICTSICTYVHMY